MKIRLLKKLRKKSSKKVYIRPPRASWDYYAIITPEKKLIFIFLAKKDFNNTRKLLIEKRREFILREVESIRSIQHKKGNTSCLSKELSEINKLIP